MLSITTLVKMYGAENIMVYGDFEVFDFKVPFLGFGITSGRRTKCLGTITEKRYKIKDNYKIEFKPLDDRCAKHKFYIMDFDSLVKRGIYKILISPEAVNNEELTIRINQVELMGELLLDTFWVLFRKEQELNEIQEFADLECFYHDPETIEDVREQYEHRQHLRRTIFKISEVNKTILNGRYILPELKKAMSEVDYFSDIAYMQRADELMDELADRVADSTMREDDDEYGD